MLVVVALASCTQSPQWDQPTKGDQGVLNLNCFTSLSVNTKAGENHIYQIELRDASNEVVFTAEDHTTITDGIKLSAGDYTAYASTGSKGFGASYTPCYTGSKSVTIEPGKTTNITITTTLDNVKVTTIVDQAVSDFFQDYDLVVTNTDEGSLNFNNGGTTVGYFRNTGTLRWTMTIYYADGSTNTLSEIISNTQIKDHYTLKFALGDPQPSEEIETTHTVEQIQQEYKITIAGTPAPPAKHNITSTNSWATFVEVSGSWETGNKPTELGVEYRVKGSQNWNRIAVVESDNSFAARIGSLTPQTQYEVRSVSSEASSAPVAFTTESTPNIQNMNMDTWKQSGKNWYANDDAADSFWGSGNEGVSGFLAGGKPSNTAPTDDSRSGKAAKLESIKVNVVNFAAGNLFTGSFSTNMLKPLDSPSFGQPYTGRPTQLKFWYKYSPKPINVGSPSGQMDKCNVYILLGTWGEQIKSSKIQGLNTEGAIAYGTFETDAQVDSYTQHTINIEYKDRLTKPTSIIIVASSSKEGESYTGGLGSTLFLDDFEFGWGEPTE